MTVISVYISRFIIALFLVLGTVSNVLAQVEPYYYGYPYNHLKWYTIETDHFMIHFQKGNSRSAQIVSLIAEEIYNPITSLYNHEPEVKVSIILKDREDYSNGAAYFFDNKIDIWVPSLDSPLRGTHNWFRNVITHEFTHIVQIQAAMKGNIKYPAWYVQWLNYEDIRRPDVLYGYPNGLISFPFANISVPAWLAEGTAQYQRSFLHYERWDAHRDMIIRTRVLDSLSHPLMLNEIASFASKTSLERETIYNHGYRFTIYLANRFGEEILSDISRALALENTQTVGKAIKIAAGIDGESLYNEFISELSLNYTYYTKSIETTLETLIEPNGFFNFYPKIFDNGSLLSYLSNEERDNSRLSLILKKQDDNANSKTAILFNERDIITHSHSLSCGHDKALINRISGSYDLSPDLTQIVFSRIRLNDKGEEYNDLYIYTHETGKEERITLSQRLSMPVWSSDGERILAVQQSDNTQNLVEVVLETKEINQLTKYNNGEQIYTPAYSPDGNRILFAFSHLDHNRTLKTLHLPTGEIDSIDIRLTGDIRDPYPSANGWLYFAAAPHDIFNIYRINMDIDTLEQVTNLTGGAFMPYVYGDTLYYASYHATGYKIAKTFILPFAPDSRGFYDFTNPKVDLSHPDYANRFHNYEDAFIPLSEQLFFQADTGKVSLNLESNVTQTIEASFYRYKDTFSKMSIFPVLRFDNYNLPNGANSQLIRSGNVGGLIKNLWRDIKPGFNFASREVIDRFSVFGGAMFGVGSQPSEGITDFFVPGRLADLDRDLFLIMEYQGLPFIQKYWSPTISVELYNLRRNVPNGLSVEEFPCVSCLPDTTKTGIAYDIWEADLFFRSKLNRYSLFELSYQYSPYQVTTNQFYSKEYRQVVPSSSERYYVGSGYSAAWYLHLDEPYNHSDIAPVGIKGLVRYRYQPSELLDSYKLTNGTLEPVYQNFKNHSVEVDARYGFMLKSYHFQVNSRFFSYLNEQNEYFFLDYIGGMTGMRAYPYFAIGGTTTFFSTFSWHIPVLISLNEQLGRFTLDKLFTRVFFETGNGWGGPLNVGNSLKSGIGAELRFSFNTQYLFPSKLFISSTYGINTFAVDLPDAFITEGNSLNVRYGKEWLFHVGLLFDFEL